MDTVVAIGILTFITVVALFYGYYRNKQEAGKLEAEKRAKKQAEYAKKCKRWREIHELARQWRDEKDPTIGFGEWAKEYGVTQFELDHIYYAWELGQMWEQSD